MHICHLALYMDSISSVLLDLCDVPGLIPGQSRDSKLGVLWSNYHTWCETTSGFFGFPKKNPGCCRFTSQNMGRKQEFLFPNVCWGHIIQTNWGAPDREYRISLHRISCALATDQNFAKFHRKFAVSATAARYLIFWMARLLRKANSTDHLGEPLEQV